MSALTNLTGLRSLMRGKLEVSVLDAASISVSLLRGDFDTAGSVMFLLKEPEGGRRRHRR